MVISAVSSETWGPLTTSTNFIARAGLKKCMLTTLSGRLVASASFELTIEELLVAKIVSGLQISSNWEKIFLLMSIFSITASMT